MPETTEMPAADLSPMQARNELKRRLREAMAQRGWSQADLAKAADLARNVVGSALNDSGGVPQTATLEKLLDALFPKPPSAQRQRDKGAAWTRLCARLVALRNRATEGRDRVQLPEPVLGRPISEWSPFLLGVHRAVGADIASGPELPPYVERAHDRRLRDLLSPDERNMMVVLVGGSSTGKTRTALEAVQACMPDRPVVHPVDAPSLVQFLQQRTAEHPLVLWLNETQTYLQGPHGHTAAIELQRLLANPGQVIALGTLWPTYWERFTTVPEEGRPDDYFHVRQLLNGAEVISVPEDFHSPADQDRLREVARHDARLAAAAPAPGGRVIQALAGGPSLVDRYEHGIDVYSKAIITAAMDAHCLDFTGPLPAAFLEAAAAAYLTAPERVVEETWLTTALRHATGKVNGIAALTPTRSAKGFGPADGYLLADYLAQHGSSIRRREPVPSETSQALVDHAVAASDRAPLAYSAEHRGNLRFATQLLAAEAEASGGGHAMYQLGKLMSKRGDRAEAERWLRMAVASGYSFARNELLNLLYQSSRTDDMFEVLRGPADAGDVQAMLELGRLLGEQGDTAGAEQWLRRIIDGGSKAPKHPPSTDLVWAGAMYELSMLLEESGRQEEADTWLREAAREGCDEATILVDERDPQGAVQRVKEYHLASAEGGDWESIRTLQICLAEAGLIEEADYWLRRGAEAENPECMLDLARSLRRSGQRDEARHWLRRTVEAWNWPRPRSMVSLLETPPRPPDWTSDAGSAAVYALHDLGSMQEEDGDFAGAERLWAAMDEFGDRTTFKRRCLCLARMGEEEFAERLMRARAEDGTEGSLNYLADFFTQLGRLVDAEQPLRQAAVLGNGYAMKKLVELLRKTGRYEEATALDRYGLDPRGVTNRP